MLPDRVSNPGPLTYESDALPTALHDPAIFLKYMFHVIKEMHESYNQEENIFCPLFTCVRSKHNLNLHLFFTTVLSDVSLALQLPVRNCHFFLTHLL